LKTHGREENENENHKDGDIAELWQRPYQRLEKLLNTYSEVMNNRLLGMTLMHLRGLKTLLKAL
jgi:hypothetical protein